MLGCIDVLRCRIICHKKILASACNIEHKKEQLFVHTLYCQISFSIQRRYNNLHLHKTQRNVKPRLNLQDVGLFSDPNHITIQETPPANTCWSILSWIVPHWPDLPRRPQFDDKKNKPDLLDRQAFLCCDNYVGWYTGKSPYHSVTVNASWAPSQLKTVLPGMRMFIIKIRRSWDRLNFYNGNSHTGKMISLYWDGALFLSSFRTIVGVIRLNDVSNIDICRQNAIPGKERRWGQEKARPVTQAKICGI